jgi:3D (Asp-Asp-Asp) domain-containing protein/lysophospholipase L1-like esterase/surface antigen
MSKGAGGKSGGANAVLFVLVGALFVAVAGTVVVIAIFAALFGGTDSDACGNASDPFGQAVGALGGVSGTGITRGELNAVRSSRAAGSSLVTGMFASTSYGPPWGRDPQTNVDQGAGVSTAGGIRLHRGAPRKYFIATDPAVIGLGQWVSVWPNPFQWRGAFLAADTGGAIQGRRLDFYDWRGRAFQNRWSNPVDVSRASTALGIGPTAGLGPDGLPTSPAPAPAAATPGPVLNLGDSLAVGSGPPLQQLLSGWTVIDRAARDRTSSQALSVLRRVSDVPQTIIVQLGSNDADLRTFRANIRSILAIARRAAARVIWVDISRPPLRGSTTTDAELNEALEAEAGRHDELQIVDWKAAVDSDTVHLVDHVHPDADGYRTRAQMIATAVQQDPGPALAGCGDDVALSSDVGERIGEIARRYLGKNGRTQPFNEFEPAQVNYSWCAWFVTNVWKLAGVAIDVSAGSNYPYTWGQQNATLFKHVGAPPRGPTPPLGSAIMYGSGPASTATSLHVNLVDKVNEDGTFMITSGNSDASRVVRQGPCRLTVSDPASLTGPGCDGRPVYAIATPTT